MKSCYEKATIYIKTVPASMGFLTKLDMQCDKCRETTQTYLQEHHTPVCQMDGKCRLSTYISERLPNVEYKISEKNIPEITVLTHNIRELERAHAIVNRAIRLSTHQLYRDCR